MRMPLFAVLLLACTPAEQQAVAKSVADAAACVEKNAIPGADPGTVALTCEVSNIPDEIAIIISVIEARTMAARRPDCVRIVIGDAGIPLDGAGK